MAKKTVKTDVGIEAVKESTVGTSELAAALVQAINATKAVEKKTIANRKPRTPWTPPDGVARLKLKRKAYQHGMLINDDRLSNDEIALFNKLRPGRFLGGNVTVTRRKDRGIDISYPIKTASQRLKLVNLFGIWNLTGLLEACIHEAQNPKPEIEELD